MMLLQLHLLPGGLSPVAAPYEVQLWTAPRQLTQLQLQLLVASLSASLSFPLQTVRAKKSWTPRLLQRCGQGACGRSWPSLPRPSSPRRWTR